MKKNYQRNSPIVTVIKNFINKKSGCVSISRNEIQRRFFGLDWTHQKKIILAFLESGKTDREWTYSVLLNFWDVSFEEKVKELWEKYHEEKCAWIVIRHLPKEYIKEHMSELSHGRNYYFICRRMTDDSDFVIDKSKLSARDYLMVIFHAQRHLDDAEATDILYEIVRDICFNPFPSMELSTHILIDRKEVVGASHFSNISLAEYYLGVMYKDDVVNSFSNWDAATKKKIGESQEYKDLQSHALSDFQYKRRVASIVQKHLYLSLPEKYKTMSDEEYLNRVNDENFNFDPYEPF